jgi:hypothetical protein
MARTKIFTLGMMLLVLSGIAALPVGADEAPGADTAKTERDWSVDFTPYLWIPGISGTVGLGPASSTIGVGFIDILTHLKGFAMADLFAHYKRVGVIADGVWLKVNASQSLTDSVAPPLVVPWSTADVDLGVAFGTGALSWQFRPIKGLTVDPYLGARWWRLHTTLELRGTRLPGGSIPVPVNVDSVDVWTDVVGGIRVGYEINEKWHVMSAVDAGGGSSRVDWQYVIGGGYNFVDWFALVAAYRILGVDYEEGNVKLDMVVQGLLIGLKFQF